MTFHYKWWGLIFVLPAVGFFAIFNLFPTLFGLYLAFTDYDLLSPPIWVGLDNFVNLWGDRLFRQAFGNTLVFVLGATVPVWVLSLLAALVFDQAFRGRDWLKAAFFLPVLAPVTVVAVVWRVLLHPNGNPLAGGLDARSFHHDQRA
jgi:multiple sugar transport system permease protein